MRQQPLVVVKCGGNADVDAEAVCGDVAGLIRSGVEIVLVHGGSAEIERLATELDVPQRTHTSPDGVSTRRTDERTLEVLTLALAGSVKPKLVRRLARHGVRAVGMTGLDGLLLRARRKRAQRAVVDGRTVLVRDNLSGILESVNDELLRDLLDRRLLPVVSPPAITDTGEALNVDADRVAAAIAVALRADTLVLLTGAPGVQADPDDDSTMLSVCEVSPDGSPASWARGGMAMKLIAAREALLGGVAQVMVADGRRSEPVRRALASRGTRVVLRPHAARAA
ncbi:[LysW]-aminoadipate kinase [Micromonospora sp. CPCC 206061]|uniref:[LysW]-aminoadipate kinase n=1 Tax=Micromonospora sp. CPCC 206061 TaxID=3122410 RepID=UPI002FEF838C